MVVIENVEDDSGSASDDLLPLTSVRRTSAGGDADGGAPAAAEEEEVPSGIAGPAPTFIGEPDDDSPTLAAASGVAVGSLEAASGGALADEVRRRFQWLSPDDQKTVVRLSCDRAQEREEALMRQLQQTIDAYSRALETGRATAGLGSQDGLGPELPREVAARYEERVSFLHGTIAALEAEPSTALPRLTAIERAKALTFKTYATTRDLGDQTGVSEPVASTVSNATAAAAATATGARTAILSLLHGGVGQGPENPIPELLHQQGFMEREDLGGWPEAPTPSASCSSALGASSNDVSEAPPATSSCRR